MNVDINAAEPYQSGRRYHYRGFELESRPRMFHNGWCMHIEVTRGITLEGAAAGHGHASEREALQDSFAFGRRIVDRYHERAGLPGIEFGYNGKCWQAVRQVIAVDDEYPGANIGEERWIIGLVGTDEVRIGPVVGEKTGEDAVAELVAFLGPSAR